jgi:hypothetical protein
MPPCIIFRHKIYEKTREVSQKGKFFKNRREGEQRDSLDLRVLFKKISFQD